MAEPAAVLAHHFEDIEQQRSAAELGMWLMLVTEVMFFGALFCAYLVYRYWYSDGFAAASLTLSLPLGTINTAVLLTSSLSMALSVQAAHQGRRNKFLLTLSVTMILGIVFLVIKSTEYYHKYHDHLIPFGGFEFAWPDATQVLGVQTFLFLYFAMTGLHALHMVIGLACLAVVCGMAYRRGIHPQSSLVGNVGLYWHFVDLVWVYLFPLFYLVTSRGS